MTYGSKSSRGGARKGSGGGKRGPGGAERKRSDSRFKKRDRDDEQKRPRVRAQRGPWKNSAYVPSKSPAPNVRPVGTPRPPRAEAAPAAPGDGKERLQKVLARCGVASRRNAEILILEGAITVNGKPVTELGTKVDAARDKIKVEGKLIHTEVEPIYLALYKPKGMISSMQDPEGRRNLSQLLVEVRERVIPIGRLDYNSEGLLLLTNDGDIAEKVLKAREMPKIYMVKVKGHPTDADLKFLQRGIFTPEGVVRVASFNIEQNLKSKSWLKLEVTEGARLDLRELLNHRGLLVDRIVRTAVGSISIQGLQPGEFRFLKRRDFEKLLTFANDQ